MTQTCSWRGGIVTPNELLPDGLVAMRDGAIIWVGPAAEAPADLVEAAITLVPGQLLMPGLVDVHCHGGGGVGFPEAENLDEVATAAREHLRYGTTSLVASLVTADVRRLRFSIPLLAASEDLAGIHIEGPFLADERAGAQNRHFLRTGDPDLIADLIRLGHGRVVTVTLAPEVPGALEACKAIAAEGAVPSFGHTAADTHEMAAAIDASRHALADGGRPQARPTATHLFNGMPPMHHRRPGPVPVLLTAARHGRLIVELIADGVHVAPDLIALVFDLVGADNVALVTDAIAATGVPDGPYELGGLDIIVADGVARLASNGALAGSTSHLLDAVRQTVVAGVPVVDAVSAATRVPAEILGRDDIGRLSPGARADLLIVDDAWRPVEVWRAGEPIECA